MSKRSRGICLAGKGKLLDGMLQAKLTLKAKLVRDQATPLKN
jgi:hypothetical protein